MKKDIGLILLLIAFLFLTSCAINRLSDEKTVILLEKVENGHSMMISVLKGSHWSHKITPGPFVIHIYPQIVFWIEDGEGKFIETLFITGANGKYSKHSTKRKMDDEFFKHCFPIWSGRVIKANKKLPTTKNPYPDAITRATPQSSFDLDIKMAELPDGFTVNAEINKSMDYNEFYTKEKSDWIGQPSLVYGVEIDKGVKGKEYLLKPIGHSDIGSLDDKLHEDFEGVDTALELVHSIRVAFQ